MHTKLTALLACALLSNTVFGQRQATITIDAAKPGSSIASTLHGIFFEEISHGGEGGLYGELIQNRGFEESRLPPGTELKDGWLIPARKPHFMMQPRVSDWQMEWPLTSQWPAWSLETGPAANVKIQLTQANPLNEATPNSLQVDIGALDAGGKNNLVNEGFWGIKANLGEKYILSFYARSDNKYGGKMTVSLQSATGSVLAQHAFTNIKGSTWKKYNCVLSPSATDGKARLVISFGSTGTVWLDFVSLFPQQTFKNRPNGMRRDLARYLADLKPAFVRWPGGCFVEGINIESAANWKRTLGPIEKRPGTYSVWGYWSSDGFGYHEYLQFCEDLGADALYVFNAGVSCEYRSGTFIPDDSLQPVVDDVLDAIEYAIGPVTTKYGKLRAAYGHPKPFPLKYVEIGNEQHGPRYAKRYNVFYDAIKKKYPQLTLMASMGIGDINKRTLDSMQHVDMADEHAYKSAYWAMNNYDHFDKYKRGDWDVYVGEYATNAGVGSGNMLAALNDAVYIMGMERNGDLVKMSSYAPLFENVNTRHWPVNLINFDADRSFGRISYYAIKMFNDHRAGQNLQTKVNVADPVKPSPQFTGGIGLATWDTQTEYRDIEVVKGGKTIYKSDFINRPQEWQTIRGTWVVKDSALAQTVQGAQRLNLLADHQFDTYTLTLKARKTGGTNAFIIPFAVKDGASHMRVHIGSYVNLNSVIELVSDSFSVANMMPQKKLPAPIQTGRWYDITIEVGVDQVQVYLDGQQLISYRDPNKFFSIAGRDLQTGEIIVKVVNGSDTPYTTTIDLAGMAAVGTTGSLITLQAESAEAENSLAQPQKYIPVSTTLTGIQPSFTTTFKPFSISILRIKDASWKKQAMQ
ncbi:alpha-L-arabinofuranosidase C-terminal domain-containing protein [Paraflavitalea sp. CAU 1676]|uniref:alpha-L-arabinofuranosidase C-terminal domain-containing protein n=1 Tax=Paraflavitalea sp. CAU 1676 TaxID=3032598 RepID=UPI0023DAA75A|nr:alpha-L-arabinofuranosidase C-terminal domain-containing protein [Paraflavitalea sp. CAU 1676]MDF2192919.1 alpha-L-arabinofuranosidase C-terminal domain-containing protein [Paraflavitalea sp. CAU 1676]